MHVSQSQIRISSLFSILLAQNLMRLVMTSFSLNIQSARAFCTWKISCFTLARSITRFASKLVPVESWVPVDCWYQYYIDTTRVSRTMSKLTTGKTASRTPCKSHRAHGLSHPRPDDSETLQQWSRHPPSILKWDWEWWWWWYRHGFNAIMIIDACLVGKLLCED